VAFRSRLRIRLAQQLNIQQITVLGQDQAGKKVNKMDGFIGPTECNGTTVLLMDLALAHVITRVSFFLLVTNEKK
jgi:hypothetical protein